jgi:hypothetical protein
MIYHVLPGDGQVEEFKKSKIDGEMIVCREALVCGPIDAENLDDFWRERAQFIVSEYGEDEIEYHEKVANELSKLAEVTSDDEVNLWFEYELFCSVNMWFCLSLLGETQVEVYRVEPIGLDKDKRWDGFGYFDATDLKAAFELRTKFSKEEVYLGKSLWNSYRRRDYNALKSFGRDERPCFPYLKEVIAAAAEQDIRPREILREIRAHGENDFEKIFIEFKKRSGVYGYGDLQVQRLLDRL